MFEESLAFDDVLLVPQYSNIETRKDIDLVCWLKDNKFSLPIISSPMTTVTEYRMAISMNDNGGLGIIHRYNSIEEQVRQAHMCSYNAGFAIGIKGDYLERAQELYKEGCRIFCIDVAHGHHSLVASAIFQLKKRFGDDIHIMAGNIATPEGYKFLSNNGADSVRVGIGQGSICSTRIETGHGVPGLQSLLNIKNSKYMGAKIILDGGIKKAGDIVKALGAGADFVMLGSLLAGTDESPGEILEDNGQKYKHYFGMASPKAQSDWKGVVGSEEGIATKIPYKGSVVPIIQKLKKGIISGLSYSGAKNIVEFQNKCKFIKQSNAAQIESSTHILKDGGIII